MLLTIITITFNAERFLERTLKSMPQDNQELEYLIIDGGSSDGTLALINQYQNKISNWVSEPDKGIYDAMNKGLKLAKGQYVWFMNAGDQIFDNQTIDHVLEQIKLTNADVLYGDADLVDNNGQSLGLRSDFTTQRLPKQLTWQRFERGMVVCHQSFITKKSIAPPYILDHFYSADIDWEINCLKAAQKTINLNQPISKYLTGGFSIKNLRKSLWDRFIILQKHFGFWPTLYNHFLILGRGIIKMVTSGKKYW